MCRIKEDIPHLGVRGSAEVRIRPAAWDVAPSNLGAEAWAPKPRLQLSQKKAILKSSRETRHVPRSIASLVKMYASGPE